MSLLQYALQDQNNKIPSNKNIQIIYIFIYYNIFVYYIDTNNQQYMLSKLKLLEQID